MLFVLSHAVCIFENIIRSFVSMSKPLQFIFRFFIRSSFHLSLFCKSFYVDFVYFGYFSLSCIGIGVYDDWKHQ